MKKILKCILAFLTACLFYFSTSAQTDNYYSVVLNKSDVEKYPNFSRIIFFFKSYAPREFVLRALVLGEEGYLGELILDPVKPVQKTPFPNKSKGVFTLTKRQWNYLINSHADTYIFRPERFHRILGLKRNYVKYKITSSAYTADSNAYSPTTLTLDPSPPKRVAN